MARIHAIIEESKSTHLNLAGANLKIDQRDELMDKYAQDIQIMDLDDLFRGSKSWSL